MPVRRSLATLLLVTHLAGCVGWRTQQVAPEQIISQKTPSKVRVTYPDKTRLVIYHPGLSGDSIVGHTFVPVQPERTVQVVKPPTSFVDTTAGIALADIRRIETRGINAGRTVLLATGIVLVVLATIAITVGEALGAGGRLGGGFE